MILWTFLLSKLLTGNERKQICKTFISWKEGLPKFWFTHKESGKFTEVFKYAITSVTLAVAVLNPTLCKPEKASLRNYIINLS